MKMFNYVRDLVLHGATDIHVINAEQNTVKAFDNQSEVYFYHQLYKNSSIFDKIKISHKRMYTPIDFNVTVIRLLNLEIIRIPVFYGIVPINVLVMLIRKSWR